MPSEARLQNLDERIAIARANIAELMERAAGASGAAAEEAIADRLNDQQSLLNSLLQQREELEKG